MASPTVRNALTCSALNGLSRAPQAKGGDSARHRVRDPTSQIASAAETSWAADASEAPECEIRPDSNT